MKSSFVSVLELVKALMKKAGLDTINAMVCSNSAMLAWRASKVQSPLHDLFMSMLPNGCTRSKAAGKIEVPVPNTKNLACPLEPGHDLECHPGSPCGQVRRKSKANCPKICELASYLVMFKCLAELVKL